MSNTSSVFSRGPIISKPRCVKGPSTLVGIFSIGYGYDWDSLSWHFSHLEKTIFISLAISFE